MIACCRRRWPSPCRSAPAARGRASRSSRPPRTSPSLTREVGGDKVSVEALARGYQDPHFVEAEAELHPEAARRRPAGRRSAASWRSAGCRRSSRRAATRRSSRARDGYLDASLTVRILDIPTGQITRAMGDVHPQGNPHYWLDPEQRPPHRARRSRDKLARAAARPTPRTSPQRYADFDKRLAEAEKRWDAAMAPYKGTKIVTYHRSWPNFAERFGLDVIGYVEPQARASRPRPAHTLDLIAGDEAAEREDHRSSSRTST